MCESRGLKGLETRCLIRPGWVSLKASFRDCNEVFEGVPSLFEIDSTIVVIIVILHRNKHSKGGRMAVTGREQWTWRP